MGKTNYEKALTGLSWFANMMMQIPEYQPSWSGDFSIKESLEYRDKVKVYLKENVEFEKLSIEELKSLGFQFLSENESLLLCPLWLADTLFPDKDHDHRGGMLAYGFVCKNGNVLPIIKSIND